jgi:diguanylate cyclase (GGDEF)-like protein
MMDIDHFKRINDNYGHAVGDKALKVIAKQLQGIIREVDIVARMGGEEFAFVLPETGRNEATNLAERLRLKIANTTIKHEDHTFQITVSFGIFSCSVQNETLDSMLTKADDALYIAKKKGRNQVKVCY